MTDKTILWVCDVQEKLLPSLHQIDDAINNIIKLIEYAKQQDWGILLTEQVPSKMGKTDDRILTALRDYLDRVVIDTKARFSAWECLERYPHAWSVLVAVGAEGHVCVLKTVVDYIQQGGPSRRMILAGDAITSSTVQEQELAMDLVASWEVLTTTTEAIKAMSLDNIKPPRRIDLSWVDSPQHCYIYFPTDAHTADRKTEQRLELLKGLASLLDIPVGDKPPADRFIIVLEEHLDAIEVDPVKILCVGDIYAHRCHQAGDGSTTLSPQCLMFGLLPAADDSRFRDMLKLVKASNEIR